MLKTVSGKTPAAYGSRGMHTFEQKLRGYSRSLPTRVFAIEEFQQPELHASFLVELPASKSASRRAPKLRDDLPDYLHQLCDVPPMTAEQEFHCYRKMHFLLHRASQCVEQVGRCVGHAGLQQVALASLDAAAEVRGRLIKANLRLVVNIAAKHGRHSVIGIDELVCIGNVALISAVDGFDYRRGFRFSTYAYRAIQNAIFAAFSAERRKAKPVVADGDQVLAESECDAGEPIRAEAAAEEAAKFSQSVLTSLTTREQEIVLKRFGYATENGTPSSSRGVRSFREIGDEMGLSKQRIAQLYARAIRKLRSLVSKRATPNERAATADDFLWL